MTPGNLENPQANSEAFQQGGFWTGDLGQLDDEGHLTLTGRRKELVNRGGQKISPREIDGITDAVVDAIPVGATGKRQRLQMWQALQAHFTSGFRAPCSAVEIILCEFTAEVLNLERMGLDDNFFNCGGNSILGVQLSVTLGELLGCYIPPTVIIRHPTPGGLSGYVLGLLSEQEIAQL